jgi:hypothetical protein
MTAPDPDRSPDSDLDRVVRAHLDADAARADPRALAGRVLARLNSEPASARPRRGRRRVASWVGAAAVAASVLVAALWYSGPRDAAASPADVVRAARATSDRNEARCYRVTVERSANGREAFPVLALYTGPRTLWTRGDRFLVEPGFGGTGAWGRDETGRVWFAPTDGAATAFDAAELPQALRLAVKVLELELPSLLDEVLVEFDLVWSDPPVPGAGPYSITATRRGDVPPFGLAAAELVIEKDTKLIRSLTLHRRGTGDRTAALTFALQPAAPPDPAAFAPEGHVRPGAPVVDRTNPVLRRLLIVKQIGEKLANGT